MKSLIVVLAVLGAASPALAQKRDAMAECRKMSAAYMEAYNKGDATALAALYDKDAVVSNPFWTASGRDVIAHAYTAELAGGTKYTKITCDRSTDTGPVGYAEGSWAADARGPDGKTMTVSGHFAVVAKPEKNGMVMVSHVANMQLPPPSAPTH